MVQNFPTSSEVSEWVSEQVSKWVSAVEHAGEVSSAEQVDEWAVEANKQTD